jgi:hypothetical protein
MFICYEAMNIYPDSNPVFKSYLKIREVEWFACMCVHVCTSVCGVDGGSDMVGDRDERGQHHVDKVKEQC